MSTIIAIGGAKGGVGKTILAVNLALALTEANQSVVLLDADFGGANCHTFMGMVDPIKSLEDYFTKKIEFSDLIIDTPYKNLRLLCGGNNKIDSEQIKSRPLLTEIRKIAANFVIIDLGAGLNDEMLGLYNLADEKIIIVTPQLTSLQNAYSFLKAAFQKEVEKSQNMALCLRHLDNNLCRLVYAVSELPSSHRLKNELETLAIKQKFWILANMVYDEHHLLSVSKLKELVKDYLSIDSAMLGKIQHTPEIQNSLSIMIPFVLLNPQSGS
ncbi:MAG: P-loop NTPase, partial [Oligoflexia bacterium]|nr:P-loop NTPase [Oligoflexia bacterium]